MSKIAATLPKRGPQVVYAIRLPPDAVTRLAACAAKIPGAGGPRALARDLILRGLPMAEHQWAKMRKTGTA